LDLYRLIKQYQQLFLQLDSIFLEGLIVMVKIVKGDLLKSDCQYIAHGVNCQGVMNFGIAKQIRDKYPEVYNRYKRYVDTYPKDNSHLLGVMLPVPVDTNRVVFNVFSQYKYGRDSSIRYVNYAALTTGLENVATFVSDHAWYSTYHSFDNAIIGLPWIGCGLANGEKSVVLEILELIERNFSNIPKIEFHIYEFDG
jgi:hypothetical protein